MGQKRKRNHWVPQSYLRAFAADPERREKIWRFSKSGGDPELKRIENVAMRFYLYAPKDGDGRRDYSFEEKLAELEGWFGEPLWADLCSGMVDFASPPVRKKLALLAAVMYLRNPAQLENWEAMHRQIVDQLSRMPDIPESVEIKGTVYPLDRTSSPSYRDPNAEDLKRSWIDNMRGAVWLAEILMNMRWAVRVFGGARLHHKRQSGNRSASVSGLSWIQ